MPGFTIEGISSGLDTTAIVNAIIEFERQPAVLMEQNQAEKINTISTLKALEAKILSLKSQALQLTRKANFNKSTVSVSDDSYLSATAKGKVSSGSFDLQILSLARNHQVATQGFTDDSLSSFGTGTISIGVGKTSPKDIVIDSTNNSLTGIMQAINDADAGVKASIINDGSDSNPFRLVITADNTGYGNNINLSSNLTGGNNININSATFDQPEIVSFNSASDAQISLGSSASYTGNENKVFTFTVSGTGAQQVGVDTIQIDWSDGTNTGSVIVSQADTEIELVGAGADGLKFSLSAGQLNSGDEFQVQTFAPLIQAASDAKVAVGSSGGTGSPITVTSETNNFDSIIPGVSIELRKETQPGDHITVQTDTDVDGIKKIITDFIAAYNDVNEFIDKQNSFNETTNESGVLLGDSIVQSMQYSIRRAISNPVKGLESKFNQLFTIGIRTDLNGKLAIKDNDRFEEAIKNNIDDVINLFTNAGNSSTNLIEFISAGSNTKVGEDYDVEISHAATKGRYRGNAIDSPSATPIVLNSSNNRLSLNVNNVNSDDIILTEKTYNSTDELITELQDKIDNDTKIGSRGITVEWVETGAGIGYIQFTTSTYGSGSTVNLNTSVSNSALNSLGLAGGVSEAGTDVQGTINGEEAEGKGQLLTGKEGNATTDGLVIKATFDSSELVGGVEGTISISKGVASNMVNLLESLTVTGDGMLSRRISSYEAQVQNIQDQISFFDERLTLRRERLIQQFRRMEEVLGQLNAQGDFLAAQLAGIAANTNFINNNTN